jgi:hypothetical protein
VKGLAEAVASQVPGVSIAINQNAPPDNRSYRVDFSLYQHLAPKHQPQIDLLAAIAELRDGLEAMGFKDRNFRGSQYMRLEVLRQLAARGLVDSRLAWVGGREREHNWRDEPAVMQD